MTQQVVHRHVLRSRPGYAFQISRPKHEIFVLALSPSNTVFAISQLRKYRAHALGFVIGKRKILNDFQFAVAQVSRRGRTAERPQQHLAGNL